MTDLFATLRNAGPVVKLLNRFSNAEAEQALLGALLTQPTAFRQTVGRVAPEDFADIVHGAIYAAIADRVHAGRLVDHLLLGDVADALDTELRDVGGGKAYLAALAAEAGLPASVRDYCSVIREAAQRRRLIDTGLGAVVNAAEAPSAEEAVAASLSDVEALVTSGAARMRSAVIAELIASFDRPAPTFPTGLPSLDRAMGGGMQAGRIYAFAGLGKRGKSLLAGTISANLNRAGVRHAYVALEMGALEIEHRQIAREIGTNSMALIGSPRPDVCAKVIGYAQNAPDNVLYVDMPGGTAERLRTEIMAARYRHRCAGAVLDYWQLVSGRPAGTSEEEHLRRVAEWLAAAAKRLGIWVLVLAQLADDGEATAVCRTGLNRNADQLYFIRGDADSEWRWMEMRASRYTPVGDIGSKDSPAFRIAFPGPHFEDFNAHADGL